MNINDQPRLGHMLEEVCAMFSKPYSEVLLHAYYRVLRPQSFEAVSKAMIRILTDESRRQLMPTAAEIKAVARHMESSGPQPYLPCQHQDCGTLLAWPPAGLVSEHSYYCPDHKPLWQADWSDEKVWANRVTPEEKREIFAEASPKAKAFLRAIPELARQMRDIPVTAEEKAASEAPDASFRSKVFELTAQGPGVNPGVFLQGKVTEDANWMSAYQERRAIVRAGGYKFDMEQAVWKRGRAVLTEEQIDGFPDVGLLESFVGRHARP